MLACQSEKSFFIAFFSRTVVLGRAMQSPGSHPSICLLLRKAAGRSKERQIGKTAISSDIGLFRPRRRPWNSPPAGQPLVLIGYSEYRSQNPRGFMWRGRASASA